MPFALITSAARADISDANPVDVRAATNALLSVGSNHACAVTTTNTLQCWGINGSGEVGVGAPPYAIYTPTTVSSLTNVASVSAGLSHTCAVKTSGDLYCWGVNYDGRLGTGNNSTEDEPVQVSALNNVESVSAGNDHTCAVLTDESLSCWGSGNDGQIGASVATRNTPHTVTGLSDDVQAVSAGGNFTCALLVNDTVQCFGINDAGQSGTQPSSYQYCYDPMYPFTCQTRYNPATPTTVTGFGSATPVAISAGTYHACAVLSNGSVACWGRNNYGQLGSTGADTHVARPVDGITNAVSVSAGESYSCAVLSNGDATCWGSNTAGQLGDGSFTDRTSPTTVAGLDGDAISISTGRYLTCSVVSSGQVQCWGDNESGELGRGMNPKTTTPTEVTAVPAGVVKIAGGRSHTCATFTNSEFRCWGFNENNQVNATNAYAFALPTNVDGVTTSGVSVTSMGLGSNHTCVGLSNGTAKCWGANALGQLGIGNFASTGTPTLISGLANYQVSKVFAHGNASCLITTTGVAKCWGRNYNGNLGVGDTVDREVPTDVVGMSGLTVVDIAVGWYHTCFMYTDGLISGHGVKCVGFNNAGMLGNGDQVDKSTPVQVTDLSSGVAEIKAGLWHTCARMMDKTVKCWGSDDVGEMGNGAGSRATTPATVPNLSDVEKIVIGDRHTCIVNSNGAMKCWAANAHGQLGDGSEENQISPVDVSGMTSGVTEIAAGGEDESLGFTCAVKSAKLYCWGSDARGQAGRGFVARTAQPGFVFGSWRVAVPEVPTDESPGNENNQQTPPAQNTGSQSATSGTNTSQLATQPPRRALLRKFPLRNLGVPKNVKSGQKVTVSTGGFTPGKSVNVYFASTLQYAGTGTADANGVVTITVVVPSDLVGKHHVVVYSEESQTGVRQAITVESATLPATGSSGHMNLIIVMTALLLVAIGAISEMYSRRRASML